MTRKRWAKRVSKMSSALALLLASGQACFGQATLGQPCCGQPQACCTPSCNIWNCPPSYKWCSEGPPSICIKCGCPKPVCCPSDAPNWGYFQTCWRQNPWGPNFGHCYGVTPASQVIPGAGFAGMMPSVPAPPSAELPTHYPVPQTLVAPPVMPR
jgi:hypothetical protein